MRSQHKSRKLRRRSFTFRASKRNMTVSSSHSVNIVANLGLVCLQTEILRKYLQQERPTKNLKKHNAENVGFYKTKKEIELEMGKHRR